MKCEECRFGVWWSANIRECEKRDAAIERAEKAEAALERATRDDGGWVPVKTLNEVQAMFDAAYKRANQAETTVAARDVEIDYLRNILKQFEDGGMSGREVREAKADERARFERETAAKMLAALWGSDWNGDADDATERILVRAAKLADHYFGAKEDAKG